MMTAEPIPVGEPSHLPEAGGKWAFLEALSDGVYGVDPHGLCTFINPAALAMLGYGSAEELVARNMHEAIHHTRPDGSLSRLRPARSCIR